MSIFTKFADWIGKVGPSPGFVAFNAHCWFAVFVVSETIRAGLPAPIASAAALALAIVKEFWFDLRYEKPAQSVFDSAGDLMGYIAGILFGILIARVGP
ncbi:MAG: hypothetical protein ACYDDA_03710 [Acidiferrobacteraceae bacterium]